ncbi:MULTISPECIES: hypothetical protein [Bacillaceae]|uniref:Uncharacterized protein n=2 Tax=Bacillaceae TaxID=186817 RepID=A0A9D5I243_9BACI|nr:MULTISPECIES: hypothetical protein [Bacillaceae]KQL58959.1 hypothetical protein AN965_00745 [Alkalicoccobacillus plakortidis]MBG9785947.1 hypothetical protein [Shouchella lehensis]TES48424.1 hypothetical protein E2L03_15035 [Shouchella lehensis]
MKTSKGHITIVFILFAIGGSVLTGIAGVGLLYLARWILHDQLFESISYVGAFFVAALPGFIGSLYWAYFFIKKEKRETKHLDDGHRHNE